MNCPVYFPAFRGMIEAWSSTEFIDKSNYRYRRIREEKEYEQKITSLSRRLFGEFIPKISFPSIVSIDYFLSNEIGYIYSGISYENQELVSSFISSLIKDSIDENNKEIDSIKRIENIENLFKTLYSTEMIKSKYFSGGLSKIYDDIREIDKKKKIPYITKLILKTFEDKLKILVNKQEKLLNPIKQLFSMVNSFFEDKKLSLPSGDNNFPKIRLRNNKEHPNYVEFSNSKKRTSLYNLSSGEKQILCMLYAAYFQSDKCSKIILN